MTGASSSTEGVRAPLAERVFNGLAGLTCLSLAWRGLAPPAPLAAVSLCLGLLHLLAAGLFFRRGAQLAPAGSAAILKSLPVFVVAAGAFSRAPAPAAWPAPAAALFVAATAWTLASLGTLGRSFAVLPARRSLVTRGPYRVVRHPAYLGELGLLAACLLASPTLWSGLLLAAGALGFALRIQAEEALLSDSPDHEAYRQAVPTRLVPGLW